MTDDQMANVSASYNSLKNAFNFLKLPYREKEDLLMIESVYNNPNEVSSPIHFFFLINPDHMAASLVAHLTFDIPDDSQVDIAIAVNNVNHFLSDGVFIYDLDSQKLIFRLTSSIVDGPMDNSGFSYMLLYAITEIVRFNNKFYDLANNIISLEQFLNTIAENSPDEDSDHTSDYPARHADEIFQDLCDFLEKSDISFDRNDHARSLHIQPRKSTSGMVEFCINEQCTTLMLNSTFPFNVTESKRIDAALETINVNFTNFNSGFLYGNFDYDISTGNISYRISELIPRRFIGKDLFENMISISEETMDDYYDTFLMLSEGQ